MHDDEYREEQKIEGAKILFCLEIILLIVIFFGLAYQGLLCRIFHQ